MTSENQEATERATSESKRSGSAQVPSTMLTVEYVDSGEGIDAALQALDDRLKNLEKMAQGLQESSTALVSLIQQQARDLGELIESVNSRLELAFGELNEESVSPPSPTTGGPPEPE